MPITSYSGGSSLEGNFRAVRVTPSILVLCAEPYLVAPGRWNMHRYVRDGQDSQDSRYGIENETYVYKLIVLARGGFGPRLSSKSSVDGCKRDVERKRSVRVA